MWLVYVQPTFSCLSTGKLVGERIPNDQFYGNFSWGRSKTQNWDEISPCCFLMTNPGACKSWSCQISNKIRCHGAKSWMIKMPMGFQHFWRLEYLKDLFRAVFWGREIPFKERQVSIETKNVIWGRFHHGKKPRILDSSELRMWTSVLSGGCCFITKPGLKNHERSMQLQVLEVQKASEGWLECGFGCVNFSHVGTPTSLDTGYNFWTGGRVSMDLQTLKFVYFQKLESWNSLWWSKHLTHTIHVWYI